MRKYLLPENGNFYKANLHCHTTLSDGKGTTEEVKEIYKRHGYSVVAFTDHNIQIPHPELADPDFLPLTGTEYNINSEGYPGKNRECKTTHLCLIATRDDIKYQVCYTDSYVIHGGAAEHKAESMINPDEPDFNREYTTECTNEMIRRGREAGYFVTYNHPTWSQQNYTDYMPLEGLNAMEMMNYDCWTSGYAEYNSRVYDDMIKGGKKLYCIYADDNHNKFPEGDPHFDSCGGWVMIKADKLEYNTIGQALLDGNFYSSSGPEIKALWFEDNKVHIECSPVKRVCVICGNKMAKMRENADGTPITEIDIEISPKHFSFRVHLDDGFSNFADTNAYYMADMPFVIPEETK